MAQTVADLKDTGVTVAPEAVVNEILPFCAQGQVGRDLLTQAEYAQDIQRNIGHQPGIARAQLANKQARQVAHMAAGLAQFLARRFAPGVLDDGDLDKVEAALVGALDAVIKSPAHLATLLKAGLMQPDGVTTTVDEDGLLSALGGNLALNSEGWITESGEWEAPVRGWYDVLTIDGGDGGVSWMRVNNNVVEIIAGTSGAYRRGFVWLEKGTVVPVVIGAAGKGVVDYSQNGLQTGGKTKFGDYEFSGAAIPGDYYSCNKNYLNRVHYAGRGFGGAPQNSTASAPFWGGGGAASYRIDISPYYFASDGAPGAVRILYHDPAKAAGRLPAPALFSARLMAPRAAADPVTVNLYDPEAGHGSVWRGEDAPAQLAKGLIAESAWLEICAAKAAEERAAWLADPETEAERFEMLRMACEAKLAATDKLTTPDYPISDEDRAAVNAYRKAIRELNHQPGAPWDGGGEATPWPEEPVVTKVQKAQ